MRDRFSIHSVILERKLEGYFLIPGKDNQIHVQNLISLLKKIRFFKKTDYIDVTYNSITKQLVFSLIVNETEWNIQEHTNSFAECIKYVERLDYNYETNVIEEEGV